MLIELFGVPDSLPRWWHCSAIPPQGGPELTRLLRQHLPAQPPLDFYHQDTNLNAYDSQSLAENPEKTLTLVAKPAGSNNDFLYPHQLFLITTVGPDSGRIIPLQRGQITVGRDQSDIQIRDPELHPQHFTIDIAASGARVSFKQTSRRRPTQLSGNEITEFQAGSSTFKITEHADNHPLRYTDNPELELDVGFEPTSPNLVLQAVMALTPLIIGVVMMLVTGMWYFLLFSGISVLVATVLTAQYRRARSRFIRTITDQKNQLARRIHHCAPDVDTLLVALRTNSFQPSSAQLAESFVIRWGYGQQTVRLKNITTSKWDEFCTLSSAIVTTHSPGAKTIIIDDGVSTGPTLRWVCAQALTQASNTLASVFFDDEFIGGTPPSAAAIRIMIDSTGRFASASPQDDQHIISVVETESGLTGNVTVWLDKQTIRQSSHESHNIFFQGLSTNTLNKVKQYIGVHQPVDPLSAPVYHPPQHFFESETINHLQFSLDHTSQNSEIDLVSQGPHLMITGTTGSGKSELLLSLLGHLVMRYPPADLALVLLDFKGGSSFGPLENLPHTMVMETNHLENHSLRSLSAISAELRRREELFKTYRVPDYQSFRQQYPFLALPRLVVAIDELRVLIEQNSEASSFLARLAATGRSLGFHLILSTQSTQGAISSEMRANIGTTICLRTATEQQSWDALNSPAAFKIPASSPGHALLKVGAEEPSSFTVRKIKLEDDPLVFGPLHTVDAKRIPRTTDWLGFSTLVCREVAKAQLEIPEKFVLPSLPEQLSSTEISNEGANNGGFCIGLLDLIDQCRQSPLTFGNSNFSMLTRNSEKKLDVGASLAWIGAGPEYLHTHFGYISKTLTTSENHPTSWFHFLNPGQVESQLPSNRFLVLENDVGQTLRDWLDSVTSNLESGHHVGALFQHWDLWAQQQVAGTFESLEEHLMKLLGRFQDRVRLLLFGSRQLAGGRLIGMISDRIYVPAGVSYEHRMVWPQLTDIPEIPNRGVWISDDVPAPGIAVQLIA